MTSDLASDAGSHEQARSSLPSLATEGPSSSFQVLCLQSLSVQVIKIILVNGRFGVISAKFRTFDTAVSIAIPPNSAFHCPLEEFLFNKLRFF